MKAMFSIVTVLALAISGCETPSTRGGVSEQTSFTIRVPSTAIDVIQGETRYVTITIDRGEYFTQDLTLIAKSNRGIEVEPLSENGKVSSAPDVQLRIKVDKDTALGKYPVTIEAIPEKGKSISPQFTVRVIAPY